MSEIREIEFEQFKNEYVHFIEQHYASFEGYSYYLKDVQKGLEYLAESNNYTTYFWSAKKNHSTIGTICLFVDSRQPEDECYFGFFECINDHSEFHAIWNTLETRAKSLGKKLIKGPINGSIWHQYRVVSKEADSYRFPSEPITQLFYAKLLESKKPSKVIEYHSGAREQLDIIINHTEKDYINLSHSGISIEKIEHFTPELLLTIFEFSKAIFANSWAYNPLSIKEFQQLYSEQKLSKYVGAIYMAKHNGTPIGFCMNLETPDAVIMKTIAVHPKYQKQGVANGLVHKVHLDAQKRNATKVIYALVRKSNKIQHFPQEKIVTLREYSAYEYKL